MAERSNELNEFGLVLGSLEPSEVTGSGFDGSVVMYASGSGAASQLFFKGADGAQKKLGFDIDALEAMTGTLDASDVFAIADVEADETDERKVTLGEYATHLASVNVGGLAVDGSKLKIDLNELSDVTMDVANDFIAFIDANGSDVTKKEKFADIVGNVAGAGLAGTAGVLSIDLSEYSDVTPANGDKLLTLDSGGSGEQLTSLADLADLYAGTGMTATNSVMNVIGGDGITANANDVAVTAQQSTITEVKNDNLVVGRTNGNDHIDFGTDHTIILKTDNSARLTVTDGKSTFSNAVEMASNLEVKGNLYVSGSLTTIDTDNLRIEDNLVELNSGDGADTRASNANAGLYISGSVLGNDVTLKVASDGGRLKASGSSGCGIDIATGGDYAIAGTSVLNATTLGTAVVASSLTSVGALAGGSITSSFGAIDNGTSNIRTGGKLILDVDATAINDEGALTLGAGQDAAVYYDGSNFVLDGASNVLMAAAGTTLATFDADGLSLVTGDSYQINSVNVLDHRTLGSAVTGSSLTAVGALAAGSIAEDFGAIDNGTSGITTGGKLLIDIDGTGINAAGALTLGQGNDAAIYWDGGSLVLDTATSSDIAFEVAGTQVASLDSDGLSLASGDSYQINDTSVLSETTLGTPVVNSKLEGVNALTSGSIASGFGTISTANNITTSATLSGTTLQGGAATLGTAVVSNLIHDTDGGGAPLVLGSFSKSLHSDIDLRWHAGNSFLQATGSVIVKAKNDSGASADGIAMFNSSGTRVAAMNAGGLTIKSGGSHVLDFGDFAGNTAAKITSGTGASMLEMSSSAGLHFKGNGATGANNIITVDVGGNADLEAIVVNNNLGIKARFYRQSSDINLKKDIAKIPNSTSLDKVMSLKPVSYKFKSDNIADIGFIAQEVAEIAPEICGKHEVTGEGISIDYSKLTTLLAGAVQQQQVQINDLKEIIAKLQK